MLILLLSGGWFNCGALGLAAAQSFAPLFPLLFGTGRLSLVRPDFFCNFA